MRLALTGASGFLGSYMKEKFGAFAAEIIILRRNDTDKAWIDALSRADVVINLAGSPVFQRWNAPNRKEILESRVLTTRRIVTILNDLPETNGSKLLISASATGIYPDDKFSRFDEFSDERGSGFLAEVVSKWEAEADNLVNPSVRLIVARLGVVIGKNGGVLKPLLPIFKLGMGGILGTGKQPTCFIHIEDVYRAFLFFIHNTKTSGLFNLVAPHPISNSEFTKILANKLHRPGILRVPAFALKIIYGQASCIMLNGANVYPHQLLSQGFQFSYPLFEDAINEVLS